MRCRGYPLLRGVSAPVRLVATSADRLFLRRPCLLQPFHNVLRRGQRRDFGRCSGLLDISLCNVTIVAVAIIGRVAPATQTHGRLLLLALSVTHAPQATVPKSMSYATGACMAGPSSPSCVSACSTWGAAAHWAHQTCPPARVPQRRARAAPSAPISAEQSRRRATVVASAGASDRITRVMSGARQADVGG